MSTGRGAVDEGLLSAPAEARPNPMPDESGPGGAPSYLKNMILDILYNFSILKFEEEKINKRWYWYTFSKAYVDIIRDVIVYIIYLNE